MNSFLDDQPTFLRDFDEMIAAAPDEGTPVSPDKIIPISAGDRGQQRDPIEILSYPAAMRGILLDYCEKVLSLQEEVKTLAPKAAGLAQLAKMIGRATA